MFSESWCIGIPQLRARIVPVILENCTDGGDNRRELYRFVVMTENWLTESACERRRRGLLMVVVTSRATLHAGYS